MIDNISYLIGDSEHPARLMHPGDALFVPDEDIEVLATPAAAPWMKISEAVDYLRAVAPRHAVLTNMHIDLDYATLVAELPAGVEPAYDGMVILHDLP